MRTTLTLDDDVARLLEQEARRTGGSFKATLNRILRLGLMAEKQPLRKRFRVVPRRMAASGMNYDNVAELIERLEGPLHR